MADISASNWTELDASNNSAAPDGLAEGCAPSGVNDWARAAAGAIKRSWDRSNAVLTSGGGTLAYTLTPTVALGSYVTGERFAFKVNATNTGASTLNISALGAKNIYKQTSAGPAALAAGDLVIGAVVDTIYDGTQFQLVSPISSSPLTSIDIHGTTAETAPATADEVLLYDASATANRRMVLSDALKVVNSLTEDASPDTANDFVLSYDTSASAVKKVKPSNLVTSSATVTTIDSGALPAAATKSFTSIPATYRSLRLVITGASSNTATRHIRVQVSTNNGSSYDTTAANYRGTTNNGTGVASQDEATLCDAMVDLTAAQTADIDIVIDGYQGGPHARYTAVAKDSSGSSDIATTVGFYVGSTTAINAIQILLNGSGNFDAGTYAFYGIT